MNKKNPKIWPRTRKGILAGDALTEQLKDRNEHPREKLQMTTRTMLPHLSQEISNCVLRILKNVFNKTSNINAKG